MPIKSIDKTISQFTEEIASSKPAPGGGGAAALIGAIGISLGDMVGELTLGKKKYADVEDEIRKLMEEAEDLRKEFLRYIDADAEVFEPLAKAYGIPKDEPGRDEIMEDALNLACSVPMDIMRAAGRAIDIVEEFAEKGSVLAVSDAGCAASSCRAAMEAASLNVFINTKAMKDRERADDLNREAEELLSKYCKKADDIFRKVYDKLKA